MKLTNKKAIELSILKWKWIVENNGSSFQLTRALPELKELKGECGLCEYYNKCLVCPIYNQDYGCHCDEGSVEDDYIHPWKIWYDNQTEENAQKVLDLIKSIK